MCVLESCGMSAACTWGLRGAFFRLVFFCDIPPCHFVGHSPLLSPTCTNSNTPCFVFVFSELPLVRAYLLSHHRHITTDHLPSPPGGCVPLPFNAAYDFISPINHTPNIHRHHWIHTSIMAKKTPPSESVSATLPAVGGSPILQRSTRAAARTVAPPSTGRSTRAAARTVAPPSAVAGAAADEAAPTVAPPAAVALQRMRLRTRPQSHLPPLLLLQRMWLSPPLLLLQRMWLSPPHWQGHPQSHLPPLLLLQRMRLRTRHPSAMPRMQGQRKQWRRPPPLLILMSLLCLFCRLILMSHLLLHWLKERILAAPRRTRHRPRLQGQGRRPPHHLSMRIHLILKSLLLHWRATPERSHHPSAYPSAKRTKKAPPAKKAPTAKKHKKTTDKVCAIAYEFIYCFCLWIHILLTHMNSYETFVVWIHIFFPHMNSYHLPMLWIHMFRLRYEFI